MSKETPKDFISMKFFSIIALLFIVMYGIGYYTGQQNGETSVWKEVDSIVNFEDQSEALIVTEKVREAIALNE